MRGRRHQLQHSASSKSTQNHPSTNLSRKAVQRGGCGSAHPDPETAHSIAPSRFPRSFSVGLRHLVSQLCLGLFALPSHRLYKISHNCTVCETHSSPPGCVLSRGAVRGSCGAAIPAPTGNLPAAPGSVKPLVHGEKKSFPDATGSSMSWDCKPESGTVTPELGLRPLSWGCNL